MNGRDLPQFHWLRRLKQETELGATLDQVADVAALLTVPFHRPDQIVAALLEMMNTLREYPR